MSLVAAQNAILAEVRALQAEGKPLARVRSIEPGPGSWSEEYFERIVKLAPAVVVAFLRAEPRERPQLDVDSAWAVICITPWSGQDRASAGDASLMAAEAIAAELHQCTPASPALGIIRAGEIERIWTGSIDKKGRSVTALTLTLEVSIDPAAIDPATLNDFLAAGVDWDARPGGGPELQEHWPVEES